MARAAGGRQRRAAGSDCAGPVGEGQGGLGAPVHAACRCDPRSTGAVETTRVLEKVKGIADTGFLVAFANRDDVHHEWAVQVASRVTEPLLTCDAVLAEAAFHLQSVAFTLALVREGLVAISFAAAEHLVQLGALAKQFADRKPDFADVCLIRMSELYPRHTVITVDRGDFRIYRRNKREMIPLITPPVR
jgi:predicted nucleic acid-binding protein